MNKKNKTKEITETTKNYKKIFCLLLTLSICFITFALAEAQAASVPLLHYLSAKAGPNQGWEQSPTKGAAITIWAENIGTTRGSSTLTIGGVTLSSNSDFAEWGTNTNPKTAKNFRRIIFWLNNNMPVGNTEIYVTVNGKESNRLPFKIDNTGNIYFVSLTGNENNNGMYTTDQGGGNGPWLDVWYSVEKLNPGDFLYMRGGDWTKFKGGNREYLLIRDTNNGTNNLRKTLTSYPGEVAVFKDSSIVAFSDYWTFANLKWDGYKGGKSSSQINFGNQWSFCVEELDHSVGLSLIGSEFQGQAGHAMHTYGDDFRILANLVNTYTINEPGFVTGYVFYLSSGDNLLVKDNEISGGSMYGIHAYDENRPTCTDIGRVLENWIIEGNWIDSSDKGKGYRSAILLSHGSTGTSEIRNITIRNNVLFSDGTATDSGIKIGIKRIKDIKIYNNVIHNFEKGVGIGYYSGGFVDDFFIKNNIFSNISGYHVSNKVTASSFTLVVENNLYDTTPNMYRANDNNAVIGDPKFVNPSTYDFHFLEGSPAIDAGLTIPSVTIDYDHNPRPMDGDGVGGAQYDIGPFEFTGTYVPPLPDIEVPSIPSGLTASASSPTEINLNWTASTDNMGVSGYKIYRDGSQVGVSYNSSYKDTELNPETSYTYNVSAYDATGNESGKSNQASATTQEPINPTTGLMGYWTLNEGIGTTAQDSSGNGNAGTINGATWTTGKIGGALSFNGSDDFVNLGNDLSLHVNDNVSIVAWIKATPSSDTSWKRILTTSSQFVPDGYGMAYRPSDKKLIGGFGGSSPSGQYTYASNVEIANNIWTHVAMTVSNGNIIKIYINGTEATNSAQESTSITFDSGTGVYIGIRHNHSSSHAFNGLIDEVRIYNMTLSASDVVSIYNDTGGIPPDNVAPSPPTGLQMQ